MNLDIATIVKDSEEELFFNFIDEARNNDTEKKFLPYNEKYDNINNDTHYKSAKEEEIETFAKIAGN